MSRSALCRPGGQASGSLRRGWRGGPSLAFAGLLFLPGCYTGARSFDSHDPTGDSGGDADGGGTSGGDESGDSSGGDEGVVCEPGLVEASTAVLRSLTTTQYRNTMVDLLGATVADEQSLALLELNNDGEQGGFASTTAGFDEELSRRYLQLAEGLAERYVGEALPQALTCDWAEVACMQTLLDGFGRRVFRRPLTADERADYMGIYTTIREDYGASLGVQTLVVALLSSPSLLYLEEPVRAMPAEADASVVPLDAYGIATRLSFFLWGSVPDDALLDAAEAGQLDAPEGIEQQVDRMMNDPRFMRAVEDFHTQWLHVDGLGDGPLQRSMKQELATFVEHVFTAGDATVEALLGASYSFIDDELAAIYGVEAPAAPFEQTELDPQRRSGVLTQLGFLHHTGEIFPEVHRGLFVRQSLLCDTLPPPPEGAVESNDSLETSRLEAPACGGCHQLTDLIGHGFDNYDGMGQFQAQTAEGEPIVAEGEIRPFTDEGLEGTFETIPELAQLLIGSEHVERCFAVQWSRYALQRIEGAEDQCTIDRIAGNVTASQGDLRQLVYDIATSEWFRSRAVTDFDAP
ncbi:MAG: DUF1592 domain-containing protein [Myxococcota bacterium]